MNENDDEIIANFLRSDLEIYECYFCKDTKKHREIWRYFNEDKELFLCNTHARELEIGLY